MITLLTSSTGKKVLLDGDGIEGAEALEIAQRLFDTWGLHADRVSRVLMYDVRPLRWAECPHFKVGEEDQVQRFLREDR